LDPQKTHQLVSERHARLGAFLQRGARIYRFWRILLKKSFPADERNFSGRVSNFDEKCDAERR
jgi:hypothetical protein